MAKGRFGEALALAPARGGSKSVPRKNIIPLLGKPMIAWAIEHALACEHITRVIVTTDDEEIAAVATSYGAEVPFMRPAELAQDLSVDIEFHRHAIEWLKQHVADRRESPPEPRATSNCSCVNKCRSSRAYCDLPSRWLQPGRWKSRRRQGVLQLPWIGIQLERRPFTVRLVQRKKVSS